ncbi:DUF6702 family protein [Halocola ammonii]
MKKHLIMLLGAFCFLSLTSAYLYSQVAEIESSRARLAKSQKTQFTNVNEHFWGERNAAIGLYKQSQTSFNHKFYVSTTNIEFDQPSKSFQITMKLFTDDLEHALGDPDRNKIKLGSPEEQADADQMIEAYLQKNFHMQVNDKHVEWTYLGKEVEYDLTYCYIETFGVPPINFLTIENTVFFDLFDDQTNLINLRINGMRETVMLNPNDKQTKIKL